MALSVATTFCALSSFFAIRCSLATGLSQDLASRQLQNNGVPSTANFISRAYQACTSASCPKSLENNTDAVPAIVVGDYLYIDGGEINFYDDGVPTHLPGVTISKPSPDLVQYLHSLSLRQQYLFD